MLSGETSDRTHPPPLSGAAFPPVRDGQVLLDAPQTHKEQEIRCPVKDENSYLPWHLTPTPEQHMILGGGDPHTGFLMTVIYGRTLD